MKKTEAKEKKSGKKETSANFNASAEVLLNSNLIEASAGTGKTYSVAILVLRLIVENGFNVKEILMVTFTKAAVAELEERVRLFIRMAQKSAKGQPAGDSTIVEIVKAAKLKYTDKLVEQRLNDAVLNLDETSVLTIHSFCQNTLTEFAFETKQLYGAEAIDSISEIVGDAVNEFWRKYITTLQVDILGALIIAKLSREQIAGVCINALDGKTFMVASNPAQDVLTNPATQETVKNQLLGFEKEANDILDRIYKHIKKSKKSLLEKIESNAYARKSLLSGLIDDPPAFLGFIVSNSSAYVKTLFGDILIMYEAYEKKIGERQALVMSIKYDTYAKAIEQINAEVLRIKLSNNYLTFDDMINNLQRAVLDKKNGKFLKALQEKYKAVFLDEFQDTDKVQYDIFSTVFDKSSILFYIGDPKQSIYAWRKADIHTYFKAGESAKKHTMNINYRSSVNYIGAMNQFFIPKKDFDTFHYKNEEKKINYIEVSPPANIKIDEFYVGKKPDIPISISESKNNATVVQKVATQVADLLFNEKYKIKDKAEFRRIRPSDIGILVRKKDQAMAVKAALSHFSIHAITVGDSKILESGEALYVLYILQGMTDINRSGIYKALLSPFTGFTTKEIVELDEELELDRFREYKALWDKDGVYAVMMKFITDFGVKTRLMNIREGGDRVLANLIQLIEILHKVQNEKQFSAGELLLWLSKAMKNEQSGDDEFQQRMESDEAAVKIVTVHSSKGLEYNIVFAPFLDLVNESSFDNVAFRDNNTGTYLFGFVSQLSDEQRLMLRDQLEQENRRLIYVAITRAVYKCYIYRNTYFKPSALLPFIDAVKEEKPSLIKFEEAPETPGGKGSGSQPAWAPFVPKTIPDFKLNGKNWFRMSYSFISLKHDSVLKSNSNEVTESYDKFIFKDLKKGALTGNMLHYIFEHADFEDAQSLPELIKKALLRFMPAKESLYNENLLTHTSHILNTSLSIGGKTFCLSKLAKSKRLNELEFDFKVPAFKLSDIEKLSTQKTQIKTNSYGELEGIMNGKMDLFFEMEGKYYILDWKSNFLGDSLSDYEFDKLNDAMNESNYHLQYYIYTLAAKKYLESRIPAFDYEKQFGGIIYLFLRGVRSNAQTGIFTARPTIAEIKALDEILTGKVMV